VTPGLGARLQRLAWPLEVAARLGIAAVVPLLTVGLLLLVVPRLTQLPEGVALRVGHTDVSEPQLEQRIDAIEALYGIGAPPAQPARDRFIRELARSVAVSVVIDQAAEDRKIVVSDQDAQAAADQLIQQRFGPNGREAFATLLGKIGASMQNVLDEIKRQQGYSQLYAQVTADTPEVTQADARALYDGDPARRSVPEQRRIGNISVDSEQEAQTALARARSGADFAALAKEVSNDPTTRDSGGDLGFVDRDHLDTNYADAAFSAPAGSVFGPVQTESGWNVGVVVQVRPARPLSFEEVQEGLRDELRRQRTTAKFREWLAEQVRDAHIAYADKYQPPATDSETGAGFPASPASQTIGEPSPR
jgi:peptidyl-prolyl cis-trans isomerase C